MVSAKLLLFVKLEVLSLLELLDLKVAGLLELLSPLLDALHLLSGLAQRLGMLMKALLDLLKLLLLGRGAGTRLPREGGRNHRCREKGQAQSDRLPRAEHRCPP